MDDFHGIPDYRPIDNAEVIKSPDGLSGINPDGRNPGRGKQEQAEKQKHEETKDNFDALAKAAEESNSILIANKSPYRFCVYRQNNDIFVDIVILDRTGKIRNLVRKNITHDEFAKWIKHIREREGLFLDEVG